MVFELIPLHKMLQPSAKVVCFMGERDIVEYVINRYQEESDADGGILRGLHSQ